MQAPATWQAERGGRGLALSVDPGIRCQPLAFFQQGADGRQQVLVERWVEEHYVVFSRRLGFQVAQRVGRLYLAGGATQRTQVLLEAGHRHVAGVQRLALSRATGQRLQEQRTAASERVQHLGPANVRREPVEQGFAHAVWRRAQAHDVGEAQLAAAPFTANDAQLAHTVMHVVDRFFRAR